VVFVVGPLAVAAGVGCSRGQADPAETTAFCVQFPQRDAAVALRLPSDSALKGSDPATVKTMMEFASAGIVEHAPSEIKPSVGAYVAALRAWQPGHDPMADPVIVASVGQINAWLIANCPPVGSR